MEGRPAGPASDLARSAPHSYTPAHLAERILTSRSALEGERKQVTVLFCDIANSTALAERVGAEAMHGVLNRFFELALSEVHRYEGTINQFLGDGFMALFGAPVAHEDHARRAVLAALAIQNGLRDSSDGIEARMGLNTGPVVVGKIGDNLRMDYTAVGDTTNLAARLEQHTQPGQILVSDATQRLVHGYVRAEQLPPIAVKGKTELVVAHRIAGRGPRRSALEGQDERPLSRFTGRTHELESLHRALTQAQAGSGQVIGILGEAGVGKSRLLHEFRLGIGSTAAYLEGRCLSFGTAMPYLPIIELIRAQGEIGDHDAYTAVADKLRSVLTSVGMEPAPALPYLLQLLGIKEGTESLASLGSDLLKVRTFEVIRHLLLDASRQRPLVLAVEDLHWIDKTSEELLASLIESLAGAAVLVLTTHRPGYRSPWIDHSRTTQIALRPLSRSDSLGIVRSVLRTEDVPEEIAGPVLARGEGNPFFLEELARSVAERGTGESVLPETIQGVLAARIDRLDGEPKRLLQTAAVIGREVPLRLLRSVWQEPGTVDVLLPELKHLEFMYEQVGARQPMLVFTHALTQEAAYDSLLTQQRQTLHERIGAALELLYREQLEPHYELLAYHYGRSANTEKALDYVEHANSKAVGRSAPTEAKAYFEQAQRLLDAQHSRDEPSVQRRRLTLVLKQSIAFQQLLQYDEYQALLQHYEPAAQQLYDPALLGRFYATLGQIDWYHGRLNEARELATRALQFSQAAGDFAGIAHASRIVQWSHYYKGELQHAIEWGDRALEALKQMPSEVEFIWSVCGKSWAYHWQGHWQLALSEIHRALPVAENTSHVQFGAFVLWTLAASLIDQGRFEEGLEYAERALEKGRTPEGRLIAQTYVGWAHARAGRHDQALALLQPLVSGYRTGGFLFRELLLRLYIAEVLLHKGEPAEASTVLDGVLELAQGGDMKGIIVRTRRLLGEIASQLAPDPDVAWREAAGHFEKSIALARQIGTENTLAQACAGFGRLHAKCGRVEEARGCFTEALAIFDRLGTLLEPGQVRAELARLPAS